MRRRPPLLSIAALGGALGPCRFQFRADLGPLLEPAINSFKPLKRMQQLQSSFTHLVRARAKLLDVLDCESDPIDCNARLIRHFKFNRGRSRAHFSFDRLEDLMHDVRIHRLLIMAPTSFIRLPSSYPVGSDQRVQERAAFAGRIVVPLQPARRAAEQA